jgi:MtN3 and saliva related transmembrane protein
MSIETLVGVGASAFTATSLLPQLIKLIREKKAEGVSIGMLVVLFTGVGLWIVYGFLKSDWIIITSNSFALVINGIIVALTIRYKGNSGN